MPATLERPTRRASSAGRRGQRAPVSFRLPEGALELVDRAASHLHQDRTTFVVAAIVEKASDVLREQTVFRLSPRDYDRFIAVLDNPPAPTDRLKALLRETPPWERR